MTTHAPLSAGDAAPDFDLEGDDGEHRSLADFAGQWLVLYFYPKDDTPGCTREAQGFCEAAARLAKLGARGAGGTKTLYGRKFEGTIRSTFLVAPDGTIARAWRGVKVDGHVDAVIAQLAGGKTGTKAAPSKAAPAAKKTAKKASPKKVAKKRRTAR